MPVYTYRREDGTTFDIKQKFEDDPLAVCPTTGQNVVRIIQTPGIIFKGSGFYVNDSKSASKSSINGNGKTESESTPAKTESKTEASSTTPPAAGGAAPAAPAADAPKKDA